MNVTGSLIIGVILGWSKRGALEPGTTLACRGPMGGYTTFSSFSYDNLGLLQAGETGQFMLNIIAQSPRPARGISGVVMTRALGGIS